MAPLATGPKRWGRGVLIVEAVVAAFLMIFAFAASTSLFHAALQWESRGASVRRAALVAEKKMGEIRAWSESFHATNSFDNGWVSPITGIQTDYPEAPGFEIEVIADQPTYGVNPVTGFRPPGGVYAPTSHFASRVIPPPPLNADFPNPQKNPLYSTFSYVRTFERSFRRIQVIVRYGNNNSQEYRAVTLVGDPLVVGTPVVSFTKIGGSNSIGPGTPADYRVNISVHGHPVDDVVCLWGVDPLSTGAIYVKPKDSNGREARVSKMTLGNAGKTRLAVRLRYRGKETTAFSDSINVL